MKTKKNLADNLISKIVQKDANALVDGWPPCLSIITHQPKRPYAARCEKSEIPSDTEPAYSSNRQP